jgi:hypothetical protein
MSDIFRYAVCHRTLETIPHKLIRVKLKSIAREIVREDAAAGFDKSFNRSRFMDSARIPDKNESFPEVSEEIFKEGQDFRITDVLRSVKTDIEADSSFFGRDADRGDSRNLRPSPINLENRGFAARRPCFSNRWNEAESAFVEKNQRNSKRFRLFLYAARHDVSTVLFSPRPVRGPLSQAFGSSSPFVSKTTKDGLDDTILRNVFELPRLSCGLSKDRWSSLPLEALPKGSLSTTVSGAVSFSPGVPGPVLTSNLQNLSFDTLSSTCGQNWLVKYLKNDFRVANFLPLLTAALPLSAKDCR